MTSRGQIAVLCDAMPVFHRRQEAPKRSRNDAFPGQSELRYYGILAYTHSGRKIACLLDGEQILTATEGDTLKRRYRVVHINARSVVIEDVESKLEGTRPIAEEARNG